MSSIPTVTSRVTTSKIAFNSRRQAVVTKKVAKRLSNIDIAYAKELKQIQKAKELNAVRLLDPANAMQRAKDTLQIALDNILTKSGK